MRVLIIAPTNFQSYATAVLIKLLKDPDIEVVGVIVHAFNLSRLKNEFKRDGKRIFYKFLNKAILKEKKSLNYSFDTPKRYLVQAGVKPNLKLQCDLNNIYYKNVSSFNSVNLIDDLRNLKIDIGQVVVKIDPVYYRPTEVELLIGDPTKAKEVLHWNREYNLQELVTEMVESDYKLFKERL